MAISMRAIPDLNQKSRVRLWSKIDKGSEDECWLWKGSTKQSGAGMIGIKNGSYVVPRVIWALSYGPIPAGLCVCHHCDVPACCNPHHLFLGSHAQNMADMSQKGRAGKLEGESCPRAHLTSSAVEEIRREYADSDFTYAQLSERFGVSGAQICRIVGRKQWKQASKEDDLRAIQRKRAARMSRRKKRQALRGEDNAMSKLNTSQIQAIRAEYKRPGTTLRELATKLGVSQTLIWYIVHKRMWAHVH